MEQFLEIVDLNTLVCHPFVRYPSMNARNEYRSSCVRIEALQECAPTKACEFEKKKAGCIA